MGVTLEGVRVPVSRARVTEIARAVLRAERVKDAMLSITFVMNREHLNRGGLTDVIAFGFRAAGRTGPIVGDVYIAPDVARVSAVENRVPVREEVTRLVVHGTLHVLGHDHPDGDGRTTSAMWRRQESLVRRLARA